MGSDITNRVQVNDHGSANSKPLKRVPETEDRLDNGSHSLTAPSTAQLLREQIQLQLCDIKWEIVSVHGGMLQNGQSKDFYEIQNQIKVKCHAVEEYT